MALNPKSGIWNSLFYFLQERNSCSDLASAIHAAYDIFIIGPSIRPNYTFVLTDGIYNKEEQYRISDTVNRCIQNGMNIFGVGIGNYPKGIELLFRQAIYSINADYLLKGISSFFGESLGKRIDTMPVIGIESNLELNDLNEIINNFINYTKEKPLYKELKDELNNIIYNIDSNDDLYNIEIDEDDENLVKDEFGNIIGKNSSMYIENILETQKILIVMLWTNELSKKESKWVHDKYISTPPNNSVSCINSIVAYYGIQTVIVKNYKDAIIELTKDENGNCPYYCV